MKIKYSVIIPVYNNKKTLPICLKKIKRQISRETEIIIIDDCSTQKEIPQIAHKFTKIYLCNSKKSGPGVARNLGVKKARGKYLIFIDSDVEINNDFFKRITEKVASLPKNSCLQGVYGLRTPQKSLASQYKNLYYFYNFFHRIKGEDFYYISSHCFIIPRKIFLSIRGFSPKIKTVIEDADLSYRLLKKGYKVILDKDLIVTHLKDFSLISLLINDARLSFAKAKHILRNLLKNDKEKLIIVSGGRVGEMYPIILNVLIVPFCIFYVLLGLIDTRLFDFKIFFILVLIFIFLNFSFLKFIINKKGFAFMIKIIPLYFLDMLFAFLGVALGTIHYLLLAKKY